jgi:putative membrane-bound dehydrogenase-like protein
MKRIPILLLAFASLVAPTFAADALRVLVASDASATGSKLQSELIATLNSHGAKASAAPESGPLGEADVLVLYGAEMKALPAERQAAIEAFANRGGGLVFLHGGAAAGDAAWLKPLIGGAWAPGKSRDFMSRMMLYVATDQHPIVRGASAFDVDDATLYDLDMDPAVHVLASAFTPKITGLKEERREAAQARSKEGRANVYDLQPQLWAYETETAPAGAKKHRAFVMLQGGAATLEHESMRTFILRGIAWTGGRENLDEFCSKEEVASLRYPAGGPERPEDTVKQFQIRPGFTATVVAAEPLINKPIAVQWDGAGRMWVAETPEYPNGRRPMVTEPWKETGSLAPGDYDRPARDRISILSDPDANGRFTKKTVFYEGLELVTGFCLYQDGVIAIAEPDIVFIHGEGKDQKVEPLYTGFKPGDTHFVGNHFIAAADGWIYANMGGGADVKKPGTGEDMARISSGMFRFMPDGSAIEQVSSKGGNGFGADVTSDGELFFGQATSGNPIQHVALPEKTLALGKVGTEGGAQSVIKGRKVVREHLPDRVPLMQIDMVGGYSAACSSLIYEGGAWPAESNGSMFCTEPILNIIHQEILKSNGAIFTGEMTRTDAEFLYSPDYWFRPVDVACGPDGALYILDFYNPVIAHSDTRGPLHSKAGASVRPDREHYFGRIYRVQYDHAKKLEIPDLTKENAAGLAKAFSHPNRMVRLNALNLMMQQIAFDAAAAMAPIATTTPIVDGEKFAPARILALWGLERAGGPSAKILRAALRDSDPAIRKTGALIAEAKGDKEVQAELAAGVSDPDPRARIAMLRALSTVKLSPDSAEAIVKVFPTLTDDITKSAAVAAAANSPVAVILAAFNSDKPEALRDLVSNVAAVIVEKQDADAFVKLINVIATKPAATDPLKRLVLEAAGAVKKESDFAVLPDALGALLHSADPAVIAAALPIAATWDKSGGLKAEVQKIVGDLLVELNDTKLPDARRSQAAAGLVGARAASADIFPAIGKLLSGSGASDNLKRDVIRALGATGDAAVGPLLVGAFEGLPALVQPAAFDLLISRSEWTNAFLDAAEAQKVKISILGPASIFRLRTHPNKEIARRSNAMLDKLRKPATNKDALIAQLTPLVTKPGNAEHGKELFTQICAVCHKFGEIGKEVGPVLTGIGAHGPEELLVSIVDPNRQIDAGYELFNVETKDGQLQSGILAQENDARIVLRSPAGDVEIPKANVKSSVNTHRSLMPEGFEGLGAESLRDILTFICGAESRFRVLDLSGAFTADTRRGLYQSQEALHDTLSFKKFGIVTVDGIPFDLVNPESSPLGGNVIVMRGGGRGSFAHTMPDHVEVPVGLPAKAFHFLGGVAGWGASKADPAGRACMKVTAVFADGKKDTVLLHNGVEFSDYVAPIDVPGSRYAEGIVKDKQIRWFTIPVTHPGIVQKLVLESFDGGPAATTAAITADMSDKPIAGAQPVAAPVVKPAAPFDWGAGTKVLVLGGGSSHDFGKWFNEDDVATLKAGNPNLSIHYTDDVDAAVRELPRVDVLVSSSNQRALSEPEMRKALADFAAAGKGIVLLHPGTWYNWNNWPEYNKELVGGGAHGHDAISEFDVTVTNPSHPVMAGLPPSFKATDELYNVIVDPEGNPIEALATVTSAKSGKTFPSVWIVKHPHSRIVCIALGHDGRVHDLDAYKKLLVNAVNWVSAH